jgi:hypothetical protein
MPRTLSRVRVIPSRVPSQRCTGPAGLATSRRPLVCPAPARVDRTPRFGPLDVTSFGGYVVTLQDGRWVTVEAEHGPGMVNAASPDFPIEYRLVATAAEVRPETRAGQRGRIGISTADALACAAHALRREGLPGRRVC